MSAEVADLFDRGRERLRTKGWCQWHLGSPDGPCCAYAALLFEDATMNSLSWAELSSVGNAARRAIEKLTISFLGPWNDAPGRTVEEILDVFARAAAAERAK